MTRANVLLGIGLVISFFAARAIHAARTDGSYAATAPTATGRGTASAAQAVAARRPDGMAATTTVASRAVLVPPDSSLTQEIRATTDESVDARELRHEVQLATIHQRAPELSPALVSELLRVADGASEQNRALRASFMLGEISEDDYLAGHRNVVRDSFHTVRPQLTKDQFAKIFQWDNDADPFNPEGAVSPPPLEVNATPPSPSSETASN